MLGCLGLTPLESEAPASHVHSGCGIASLCHRHPRPTPGLVLECQQIDRNNAMRWQVVKLGGSLLACADLRARLRGWLASGPPAARPIVVGGGAFADAVRALDRAQGLSPEEAHWLAIRAMGLSARAVHALLPELPLVERLEELPIAPEAGCAWLLDPWRFLRAIDGRGENPLPAGWQVTSDSIAARLAEHLGAAELTLLKSALPDAESRSRAGAAAAGYVDEFFPSAAKSIPRVRCVDIRSNGFPQCELA